MLLRFLTQKGQEEYCAQSKLLFPYEIMFKKKSIIKHYKALTRNNVLHQDLNIAIAVTACLLMVEAQGMQQFMLHHRQKDTSVPTQRHDLAIAPASNKRETATNKGAYGRQMLFLKVIKYYLYAIKQSSKLSRKY